MQIVGLKNPLSATKIHRKMCVFTARNCRPTERIEVPRKLHTHLFSDLYTDQANQFSTKDTLGL
jgi:hypothetical protein